MRRHAAAAALSVVVLMIAGCAESRPSDAAPPDPAPPSGLVLRLEPARAPAGGLITLSIKGDAAAATDMSVTADFQRWDGRSWRTEYLLDARDSTTHGPVAVPAGEQHFVIDMALVGTQILQLKVPAVAPGEYRIAKEVTREGSLTRQRVALYGRLRVVA
jgi:hypothetical protein